MGSETEGLLEAALEGLELDLPPLDQSETETSDFFICYGTLRGSKIKNCRLEDLIRYSIYLEAKKGKEMLPDKYSVILNKINEYLESNTSFDLGW